MISTETQLSQVLRRIAVRRLRGPLCRLVEFRHLVGSGPRPAPLCGLGSRAYGGRFTPKGAFETVYLAEDPVTALAEVRLVFEPSGARRATPRTPPWGLISVDALLSSVLELTDERVRSALRTDLNELLGPWRSFQLQDREAPTQTLGRRCYQLGRFDGIRYPSSKNPPAGVCVAVFPDRLRRPAHLRVFDPHGNLVQEIP